MPLTMQSLTSLEDGLETLRVSIENALRDPQNLDSVVEETNLFLDEMGRLRGTMLTHHERELLGLIQLAVAADLAPLELVERSAENSGAAWDEIRREVRDRIDVDLGHWNEASKVNAISEAALPLIWEAKAEVGAVKPLEWGFREKYGPENPGDRGLEV